MPDSCPTIHFDPPRAGWIRIVIAHDGVAAPLYASSVFDPFPAFSMWLEQVARGELPAIWRVNEEDSAMMLTVRPDPTGGARLILAGDTPRSDDSEDDTAEWRTFLDVAIEPAALARAFGAKFQAYLQAGFSPEAWGADLRHLALGAG